MLHEPVETGSPKANQLAKVGFSPSPYHRLDASELDKHGPSTAKTTSTTIQAYFAQFSRHDPDMPVAVPCSTLEFRPAVQPASLTVVSEQCRTGHTCLVPCQWRPLPALRPTGELVSDKSCREAGCARHDGAFSLSP